VIDGALFPIVLLASGYVARTLLIKWVPLAVFKVAIPVLVSLVVIRIGAKVLQVAFPQSAWVKPIERSISWLAWMAMVLWVTGLLPLVLGEMEQIHWKVGNVTLSLRTMVEGALTAGAVLLLTLWVSAAIESRLLRSATGAELSLRKAISNALRALMVFFGLIISMSAVGIDLTALSVLGGAVGVGIGLGLQKLAANYVSGFVILTERSMRIGDNVRVDNFEGRITNINARYTVVRSSAGRESIVPNEMMITQRVENLSLADPRVWLSTVVSVAYDSDVDLVIRLLRRVCPGQQPRVARSGSLGGAVGLWRRWPGVHRGLLDCRPRKRPWVCAQTSTAPSWRRCGRTRSTSRFRSVMHVQVDGSLPAGRPFRCGRCRVGRTGAMTPPRAGCRKLLRCGPVCWPIIQKKHDRSFLRFAATCVLFDRFAAVRHRMFRFT
jgi:small-conductance mechanosensitive channel